MNRFFTSIDIYIYTYILPKPIVVQKNKGYCTCYGQICEHIWDTCAGVSSSFSSGPPRVPGARFSWCHFFADWKMA